MPDSRVKPKQSDSSPLQRNNGAGQATSSDRTRVLLILPTLNEEQAIRALSKEIPSHIDVVVVDSYSTDKTKEAATEAGYMLLEAKYGRGQGSGIRTGLEYFLSRDYTHVAMIDSDYTDNPADIDQLVSKMMEKNLDVIVGIRDFRKQLRYLGITSIIIKVIVGFFIRILMGWSVKDATSGFFLLNRRAAEAITPMMHENQFSFNFEIIYLSWLNGLKLGQADVDFRKRVGTTKLTLWKRFVAVLKGIEYGLLVLKARVSRLTCSIQHDELINKR